MHEDDLHGFIGQVRDLMRANKRMRETMLEIAEMMEEKEGLGVNYSLGQMAYELRCQAKPED